MENIMRIEDSSGNAYYPQTKAKATFMEDGKNVEQKISEVNTTLKVLNDDRGYSNSPAIQNTDANLLIDNGKYFVHADNVANLPTTSDVWYLIDVISNGNRGYVRQTASVFNGDKAYIRYKQATTWTAWQEISTTETAEFTLLNGWQLFGAGVSKNVTRSGKIAHCFSRLKDGTYSVNTAIATLPFIPKVGTLIPAINANGTFVGMLGFNGNNLITATDFMSNSDVIFNFTYECQ